MLVTPVLRVVLDVGPGAIVTLLQLQEPHAVANRSLDLFARHRRARGRSATERGGKHDDGDPEPAMETRDRVQVIASHGPDDSAGRQDGNSLIQHATVWRRGARSVASASVRAKAKASVHPKPSWCRPRCMPRSAADRRRSGPRHSFQHDRLAAGDRGGDADRIPGCKGTLRDPGRPPAWTVPPRRVLAGRPRRSSRGAPTPGRGRSGSDARIPGCIWSWVPPCRSTLEKIRNDLSRIESLSVGAKVGYIRGRLRSRIASWLDRRPVKSVDPDDLSDMARVASCAFVESQPRYPGRIHLFRASIRPDHAGLAHDDPACGWGNIADGGVEVWPVPGDHVTMLDPPNLAPLASALRSCILNCAGVACENEMCGRTAL